MQRRPFHMDLPVPALSVISQLCDAGYEAFAVGGAVRDAILGLPAAEIDVATSATPEEVSAIFPRTHDVGAQFGVTIVVEGETALEVATFREDGDYEDGRHPRRVRFADLESDARRRDFSVNALYYDPVNEEILDPTGGLDDLANQELAAIGEARRRFGEDHLRLLRCARFAAQLDFVIAPDTWDAMVELAAEVETVSKERVGAEMEKILMGPRPARGLRILLYSGLLSAVLPEIVAMVGVEQPAQFHPEGDVFVHTCLVLEALERRDRVLSWSALLHDVGKPPTFRVAERIRFDGHVSEGMEMARHILMRLRLDNDTIERVVDLVRLHLKFSDVKEMRAATLKRFLRSAHFEDHLALHRADCLGSHGQLDLHRFCEERLAELSEEDLRPPPLLTGKDLMDMGYAPGPLFGEILTAVEDAQLDGTLTDRAAAVDFVREGWPPPA
jgi:poly(A) polymerase